MNKTESYQDTIRQIARSIMEEEPISYADGLAICEAICTMERFENKNKAQAKTPVNKGTSEFETTMEINGNSYPCFLEYEDNSVDGIIIYGVTVSREIRNTYSYEGEFTAIDHIVVDMTEFLTDADKAVFADEIADWMRQENAAA